MKEETKEEKKEQPTCEDKIEIRGRVHIELIGPDGKVKEVRDIENLFVNTGRSALIDRLQGNTPAVPDYIAIGTGASAVAAADTALQTEVARAQGALSQPDPYTDRCSYTFPAGVGTGTIAEAGRLNAAASGILFGRLLVTPTVPKGAADSLQINYDFTYAAS